MIRNKFLISSALSLCLFSTNAMADGALACSDITQVRYMLQKYAVNDPDNYCIRATTLAESNPSMREEVLRESNAIAKKHGLAAITAGCPPTVVQAVQQQVYTPPPQYVQYQPVQQGIIYQQPAPVIPQAQVIERVAGPVIEQGSRVSGTQASLLGGSALLWGGLGLLVAGGTAAALISSTGTSTGTTTIIPPDEFITDEYTAQYSLTTMDAASAYRRGYTGSGVNVAVLDTGLDLSHSEFAGRVAAGNGADFATTNSGTVTVAGQPAAGSLNAHGTQVAGVIAANRDFIGMHGVAYNAQIVPLRVFDGSGGAVASFVTAINYATSTNARILNGSYGPDDAWHNNFEPLGYQGIVTNPEIAEADAYKSYVAAGGMLVFPAGNAYLIAPGLASNPTGPGFLPFIKPANANIVGAANGAYRDENGNVLASADYSSLQPNTIVVAGVDRNNVISAFSNRCGVAAAWCMVAPDEDIFTTTVDNPNTLDIVETYTTVTGTSFAAPQVAGLLALLKQQFPNLTHPQIVARALNTATDLGAAGVDAIYGHGLLNVAAATNPVGVTGISTNGLLGGNYRSLASSTISYGSAFGSNAASAFNNVGVVFLDQDNAAFLANMGSMTRSTAQQFNTNEAFDRFARPAERQEIDMGSNTKVGFSTERNTVSDHVVGDNPREEGNTGLSFRSFSLTQSVSNETQGSVHYKDSSALMLGFSDGDRARVDRAINKNALSNPYASFAGNGFASVIKTEGLGGTIKVAGFFGNSENDSEARNFGTQAELGYNLDKGADAYVSFGTLFEGNRVLGSKGEGALAFGNGTGTVYMGLGGKYSLDTTTTLHVAGYAGMTNPSVDADNSLIKQASEIITSSFNASVERAGQFTKGDSVGFGISQPLRVESGNMQFAIPVALAVDGDYSSLLSSNFTQDLSAQGREMDLQFNYAFPMGKDETITMGALYRMDAGHVAGKDDMLGLTRWSKKF